MELMPWAAKAQGLIRERYRAVSAAAAGALPATQSAVTLAEARGIDLSAKPIRIAVRADMIEQYTAVWRRNSLPMSAVTDMRLALFHVIASAGNAHTDKDHLWHMETAAAICVADDSGVRFTTAHQIVDLADPAIEAAATACWEEI